MPLHPARSQLHVLDLDNWELQKARTHPTEGIEIAGGLNRYEPSRRRRSL